MFDEVLEASKRAAIAGALFTSSVGNAANWYGAVVYSKLSRRFMT